MRIFTTTGGCVRPIMYGKKQMDFNFFYNKDEESKENQLEIISNVDFGSLGTVPLFKGTHLKIMTIKFS